MCYSIATQPMLNDIQKIININDPVATEIQVDDEVSFRTTSTPTNNSAMVAFVDDITVASITTTKNVNHKVY